MAVWPSGFLRKRVDWKFLYIETILRAMWKTTAHQGTFRVLPTSYKRSSVLRGTEVELQLHSKSSLPAEATPVPQGQLQQQDDGPGLTFGIRQPHSSRTRKRFFTL